MARRLVLLVTAHAMLVVAAGCASGRRGSPVTARVDRPSWLVHGQVRSCSADVWLPSEDLRSVRVHGALSCPVRHRLVRALGLANSMLRRERACSFLFEELGHNGVIVLGQTYFFAADARMESELCDRAEAFTVVGARWTALCRSFATLTDLEAAVVVLHEALHHAGATEWPSDPRAPTSSAITAEVARRCGLASGR